MSIGIEQLNVESMNTQLATDEELANLVGVTKKVLLEKLGRITEEEQEKIGIIPYKHPDFHLPSIIKQDSNNRFVSDFEKTRWNNTFTKGEVENLMSAVISNIDWSETVSTLAELQTKYPLPKDGMTVQVVETGNVYRFDARKGTWVNILVSLVPMATDAIAGKISAEDYRKLKSIEFGANHYVHPEYHNADEIVDGQKNKVFTRDLKDKLMDMEVGANHYVHPDKHNPSIIEQDSKNRFVSDSEKTRWNDKYTRVEVDNRFSSVVSGFTWKHQVQNFTDLMSEYPNPQIGWTVNVISEACVYRWNGSEWDRVMSNFVPMASESEDGRMSSESFIKLQGIEEGADKHKEGDGYFHLPIMKSDKKHFVLSAGAMGLKEQLTINVSNGATVSGTFGVRVVDKDINKIVKVKVAAGETASAIARKIESAIKLDDTVSGFYSVENPSNPGNTVILTGRKEAKRDTRIEYVNILTDIKTHTETRVPGINPLLEVFTLRIDSSATSNGYITLYLNNGQDGPIHPEHSKILDVSVAAGDSPRVIGAKIRNAIISNTPYTADVVDNTVIVTAPLVGDEADAVFIESNGVIGSIVVTTQGTTGQAEENIIRIESDSKEFGTIGISFNDGTINKNFNILTERGETAPAIAGKIRKELGSDIDMVNTYLITIAADEPNTVSLRKKVKENIVTVIAIREVFTGVGGPIETNVHGVDQLDPYWRKPLELNGKIEGKITTEDLEAVLGSGSITQRLEYLYKWQQNLNDYVNMEDGRDLVTTINDIISKLKGIPQEDGKIARMFEDVFVGLEEVKATVEAVGKLPEGENMADAVVAAQTAIKKLDSSVVTINAAIADLKKGQADLKDVIETQLKEQLEETSESLEAAVKKLKEDVEVLMNSSQANVDAKIVEVEGKIKAVDTKVQGIDSSLTSKISATNSKVTSLESWKGQTDSKIGGIETWIRKTDVRFDDLEEWKSFLESVSDNGQIDTFREMLDFFSGIDSSKRLVDVISDNTKLLSYTANFSNTGTVIQHNLGHANYSVSVTPIENPNGRLGEIYVEKGTKELKVFNSGSFAGKFDIQISIKK